MLDVPCAPCWRLHYHLRGCIAGPSRGRLRLLACTSGEQVFDMWMLLTCVAGDPPSAAPHMLGILIVAAYCKALD